ncbi:MAG: SGNH/GDSL hydrolase family protein [Planctomycetes bacterium]|nr:SGNH/GDSL hydrolase family protein [Planctomycetota bacterium]
MPQKTKVLIIGDSISIGYTPTTQAALGDGFAVAHNEGNAEDSANLLAHLDEYLAADSDAALVHFNCGLHDIKTAVPGDAHQVPLDRYRENLRAIVARLKATGKPLVWATTTPIHDQRHYATHTTTFHRYLRDVLERNAVADEIMAEAGIPVNDLHAVIAEAGVDKCVRDDGVHMTEEGSRRLGAAVARVVRERLRATG